MAKSNFRPEGKGRLTIRVMDFEHGVRIYREVKLVRIQSKLYSLLVMQDYLPALGEINGSVELLTETEEISMGEIHGFFMNRHNNFSLLIAGPANKNTADEEAEND